MYEIRLTFAGIESKQISQKASNSRHACRHAYSQPRLHTIVTIPTELRLQSILLLSMQ